MDYNILAESQGYEIAKYIITGTILVVPPIITYLTRKMDNNNQRNQTKDLEEKINTKDTARSYKLRRIQRKT